jgi:hypothetical protein
LLLPSLTREIVERIIRLALVEKDPEVVRILLAADRLPAAGKVVRALWKAGLPLGSDAARHVDFADDELLRFAENGGPAMLEDLLNAAETKVANERFSGFAQLRDTGRFLARIAFGAFPGALRERAFSQLQHAGVWDPFSSGGIGELFGGPKQFAQAILEALEQPEPGELLRRLLEQLRKRWEAVAPVFVEDHHLLKRVADQLAELARGQASSVPSREAAAKLLVVAAVTYPDTALPPLAALLRDRGSRYELRDVPGDLLAGYEEMRPLLVHQRKSAVALADALAEMCAAAGAAGCEPQPLELLLKLVGDHDELRPAIAKRLGSLLEDRESCTDAVTSALDDLSVAVAPAATPSAAAELDHLPLLPSDPLKSLDEYVAFMKSLGASADPSSVMAAHGMDQEGFIACLTHWNALLAGDDRLALRYAALMRDLTDEPIG